MPNTTAPIEQVLPDLRIKQAMDWLLTYQLTLRSAFGALPEESKQSLAKVPNPHLATGPMQLFICSNGVVASINNGSFSSHLTAEVVIPKTQDMTIVEYFNSQAKQWFTFMEPISKLTVEGQIATFATTLMYDENIVMVVIIDKLDRNWLPPASKVFLIGWKYFESGDLEAKAKEAAQASLTQAYGRSNLHSSNSARRLLDEYRSLLETATNEAALQTFLEAHPEFLCPEYDLVLARPSLGGERQPDFAFRVRSALGMRWIFVEIERPNKSIFTRGGDFQFTREFTQAKGQLLQWDTLITEDLGFFARRFEGLLRPEFHLVYGRDAELDPARQKMLSAEFASSANRTFDTFDDLDDRFEKLINRVFPEAVTSVQTFST